MQWSFSETHGYAVSGCFELCNSGFISDVCLNTSRWLRFSISMNRLRPEVEDITHIRWCRSRYVTHVQSILFSLVHLLCAKERSLSDGFSKCLICYGILCDGSDQRQFSLFLSVNTSLFIVVRTFTTSFVYFNFYVFCIFCRLIQVL